MHCRLRIEEVFLKIHCSNIELRSTLKLKIEFMYIYKPLAVYRLFSPFFKKKNCQNCPNILPNFYQHLKFKIVSDF